MKALSSIPLRLRLGLTLTIAITIILSSTIVLASPVLAKTSNPALPTISTIPSAPSTISQGGKDGDFTTQAILSLTRATQTSNIVNSRSYYDVMFRTSTSGVIKTVGMDFPEGTYVGASLLVEATGIGPGTIAADNIEDKITYTVTNAVNVPANTKFRIQLANINNPPDPSEHFTVTITTKNPAGTVIDGPTATNAYKIKQIGTEDIADNAITSPKILDEAITSTKPAESFMKRVTVIDDAAGHAVGWDPDGVKTSFTITDPDVGPRNENFVSLILGSAAGAQVDQFCSFIGTSQFGGSFGIGCDIAPPDGDKLDYMVTRLPAHCIAEFSCA